MLQFQLFLFSHHLPHVLSSRVHNGPRFDSQVQLKVYQKSFSNLLYHLIRKLSSTTGSQSVTLTRSVALYPHLLYLTRLSCIYKSQSEKKNLKKIASSREINLIFTALQMSPLPLIVLKNRTLIIVHYINFTIELWYA